MEKLVPHTRLSRVKRLVQDGHVRSTMSALSGAGALGLEFSDMVEVVMQLESTDFYKSMTTYSDHRVWQDVYRPNVGGSGIYLKLSTTTDEVLIVSFKEQ